MFTTAQAQALGVRRSQVARMAAALWVEPVCFGVYRYTAGAEPAQAELKARWLSVFPKETAAERLAARPHDAVLAGRSAACALGAGDFRSLPCTFIVGTRRQTSRDDVRFLQCALDERDVVYVDGLPATGFERTVFDLLRLGEDPDLVDGFMGDAARKCGHTFDGDRLARLLSGLAARYGFQTGEGLAADLISRNAAGAQMARAGESMRGTVAAVYGEERAAEFGARIAEAIAGLGRESDG